MTSTQPASVLVGHYTDVERRTGCTVILLDHLCPAVVDIRGGAPGTRETDLLQSDRLVGCVDAILLTGGSAFGLDAAAGVMQFLRERGRGFTTGAGGVPIVPAAVIYDLGVGEAAWPTADDAYSACEAALLLDQAKFGRIGAGTGATYRKLWPTAPPLPGGIGMATRKVGDMAVTAISVVNAVGDITAAGWSDRRPELLTVSTSADERTATTLVAVIIDGSCDERTLRRAAVSAHDGMARAIVPCHTMWDGDLVFAVQTGETQPIDPTESFNITVAAELAVEDSIQNAVDHSVSDR